jgi:peptidoglycan hydrolase-like protein with peptidoglycan-binding domain
MKKLSKQCISIFLTVVIVISILPISAFAATYRVNYWSYPVPSRTLSVGCSGNDVRWLQCALNGLTIYGDKNGSRLNAPKLNVDGYFGAATKAAVLSFQSRYGLQQDGLFGTASRSRMRSMLRSSYIDPAYVPDQTQNNNQNNQTNPGPTYASVPKNVTEGTYYIRNKQSNKYLDVKGGSSYNGAELVQFPFHGDANQQFQITYENGAYKIYTKIGGDRRCLDLRSSSEADTNGTDLMLYDASSSYKEQNFRFESLGDGSYHIGSYCSNGNKVLEVTNSSYDDCATVQIWQRDNSRINDDWYLEPVNDHYTSVNKVRQAQMNVKSRKQYDSIDDAALDFIMAYDGMSVAQNREYGAGIVPVGNNKYTFNHIVWGPVRNSVNGELGDDNWREINSYDAVAYVHTHGQMWYGEKANLVFSPEDMDAVDKDDYDLKYAYLGNAYGDVYKYVKGETNTRHSYDEFRANSNKYSGHYITTYSKCVTDYWTDTSFSQNNGAGIYRLR